MTFDELNKAVNEAKAQLDKLDTITHQLAGMIVDRLHNLNRYGKNWNEDHKVLCQLKRELRDYNMSKHRWVG